MRMEAPIPEIPQPIMAQVLVCDDIQYELMSIKKSGANISHNKKIVT